MTGIMGDPIIWGYCDNIDPNVDLNTKNKQENIFYKWYGPHLPCEMYALSFRRENIRDFFKIIGGSFYENIIGEFHQFQKI